MTNRQVNSSPPVWTMRRAGRCTDCHNRIDGGEEARRVGRRNVCDHCGERYVRRDGRWVRRLAR